LVYCARPKLLRYFHNVDREDTGRVNAQDWASAMHTCIIPDDKFPWEEISQYLAEFDSAGFCQYGAFLARYTNALSLRLEQLWGSHMLWQLFNDVGGKSQMATEWDKFDCNKVGYMSYLELRALFKTHIKTKDLIDDDWVYTLLGLLDHNRKGYVDRDAFLNANTREFQFERQSFFSSYEDDPAIHQCWDCLHAVLRALSRARGRASSIFHALDGDQDGSLTRVEFKAGLEQLLGSAVRSFQHWEPLFWRLVDEDSRGCVALQKLASALHVCDVKMGLPLGGCIQHSN